MTNAEMEQVFLTEIPVKELVLDSGICEFYEENDKSIGVSYETSEETKPQFIFSISFSAMNTSISAGNSKAFWMRWML